MRSPFLVGTIASMTLAAPVAAEDAFTGFYGGLGAGYGFHEEVFDSLIRITSGAPDPLPAHDSAALSLLGGYTAARGDWIIGGEVELSFFSADFSETDCVSAAIPCSDLGLFGTRDNALRVRAIVGQAVSDTTFLFATAGLSMSQVEIDGVMAAFGGSAPFNLLPTPDSATAVGYNFGVGAEHRLTDRFSLRGDVSFERLRFDSPINANLIALGPSIANLIEQNGNMGIDAVNFSLTAMYRF